MALSVGDQAPDFSLPSKTADGAKLISLREKFAQGNVVLLFFPMAFTGTCTKEMCGISEDFAAYNNVGATVLGISGDNPFAQEAWAQREKISIPLLSDYEHEVARSYGVAYESFLPQASLPMGGVPKRASFIIDRQGVIQYAEVLEDARELPDFEKIKARLAELK